MNAAASVTACIVWFFFGLALGWATFDVSITCTNMYNKQELSK